MTPAPVNVMPAAICSQRSATTPSRGIGAENFSQVIET
jgi:hypothetical protein